MARKQHKLDEVFKSLRKKQDVKIHESRNIIFINKSHQAKNDLGNGSWGKIDFLVNYMGFLISNVYKNNEFLKTKEFYF